MPKIQSTFYEANPMPESAIHVLLVGVGHYHHLAGGDDPKPGLPGLAQLKSPPLSAIALAVGFSSGPYFSRVFRQEVGVSPSEYRQAGR